VSRMRWPGWLAAAIVCASCGSGSHITAANPAPAGQAAFAASVERACATAVRRHAGHPFPVSSFDPEHPQADVLPRVGNYLARYGDLSQVITALHALTPPAGITTRWENLLQHLDQAAANAHRQITAAQARDVAGFVRTATIAQQLSRQINAAGSALGLSKASSCEQVFG
jgi:hypothetical protein